MLNANIVVLYVDQPLKSRAFYQNLLQREPVEASDNFCGFAFDSGLMLGLWSRRKVEPAASSETGGGEVVLTVADAKAVDALHEDWRGRGIPIAQAPTVLDFGRTFVALDPDGHRLRVLAEPGR